VGLVSIVAIVVVFLTVLSPHKTALPGPASAENAAPEVSKPKAETSPAAATPPPAERPLTPAEEHESEALRAKQGPLPATTPPAGAQAVDLDALIKELEAPSKNPAPPPVWQPAAAVRRVLAAGPEGAKALSPETLYAAASPAVVQLTALNFKSEEVGEGTGFIISADGLLVTNYHVVCKAKYVRVTRSDGSALKTDSILTWDEKADLAVLKADATGLPFLVLAPAGHAPAIGSKVWAIGNPQGLANSLSEGIVSGMRPENGIARVQCTAAISPGSSGGPLLDDRGRVVGVVTCMQTDSQRLSQNLNFAIGSEAVRGLLASAQKAVLQPVGACRTQISSEEHVADARASVRVSPNNAHAWQNLGQSLKHSGFAHYEEARDAYRKARELDPMSPDPCYGLAEVLWHMKDYNGVAECLSDAERLEPDVVKFKKLLGNTYNDMGRYREAIGVLREVIRLRPEDADARSTILCPLMNSGDFAGALRECDEAERLDPGLGRFMRKIVVDTMERNKR
jgi:S1-C subfamily serine protease